MSANEKQLWILAGGNGSGKSTFYRTRLQDKGIEFVNADQIEKQLDLPSSAEPSYQAATVARWRYHDFIDRGRSFCFETVFSHESKVEMLALAKENGYHVTLVFIHLDNTDLNELRVMQRISEGGHWVPREKIAPRISRTLALMKRAVALADDCYLLDNSSYDDPFRQIAIKRGEEIRIIVDPLPKWAVEVLSLS